MLVELKNKYIVKSNRESGYGRVDVLLIPRDKKEKGLIIEFKKYNLDEDKNLKDTALRALKQINKSEYVSQIKSHGIKETIKVGIAFQGKKVEITSNMDAKKDRLSETQKIARNLLKNGVDLKIIIETTGLSEDEIKNI
jgi:hypothetical protein